MGVGYTPPAPRWPRRNSRTSFLSVGAFWRTTRPHVEANLPTEQPPEEAQAWLPGADEDAGRARHLEESASQGQSASIRLKNKSSSMGAIRSGRDFDRIYSLGRRGKSDGIAAIVSASSPSELRLGLSVSKACGNAVVRNRVRRRLKAAFAAAAVPSGLDVVLRPDPRAGSLPFQELVKHVETAVTRAKAAT